MAMSAGKKCIEEEAACTDLGKQGLVELKKIFNPPLSMSLCDFFPALKWIGYKGFEKRVIKLRKERDDFLQHLVDEIRQKRTCSSFSSPDAGVENTTHLSLADWILHVIQRWRKCPSFVFMVKARTRVDNDPQDHLHFEFWFVAAKLKVTTRCSMTGSMIPDTDLVLSNHFDNYEEVELL
ncbi:unnamed protein product [Dovyalis caffra]|uniref:Uncharacterized protein n=1 Tax=Dovyalis caffra TaxID=77055 RepID=A0AAV1SCA7_9ROSI|nr:unnamed protein product [Dovyalis caffra]